MSLKPYVFVPPGAGRRRVVPVKSEKTVLDAGWLLTAVMGFLLMGVVAWISMTAQKDGLHQEALGNVQAIGSALMAGSAVLSGLVLYALLILYSFAWLVVPLVAMTQGKGWGAILFFLGSPVLLVVAGVVGCLLGIILRVGLLKS